MALSIRNISGQSIDLSVLTGGADGPWRQVYPEQRGEANRFERGTPQQPAQKRFALPAAGGRLLLVASPVAARSAPRLFGLASDSAFNDLRLRGQARPESNRQVFAISTRWGEPMNSQSTRRE